MSYRQSWWCRPGQPRAQLAVSRIAHAKTRASTSHWRARTAGEAGKALAQYKPISGGATLQYGSYRLELANAMLAAKTISVATQSATNTVRTGVSAPRSAPVAIAPARAAR